MRRWLASIALIVLAGCGSDSPNAGGGGFGGETISGIVVDSSGAGVPGARIRLHRSLDAGASALRESVTDTGGRFSFSTPGSGAFRLGVSGRVGTDSVKALVDLEPGSDAGTIVASAPRRRSIRVLDAGGSPLPCRIQVYGLDAALESDGSGTIDLSSLPAADLWVRVLPRSGQDPTDLFVPADTSGDLEAAPGWTIDGFEQTANKTRLGLLAGGGWWYVASAGVDTTDSSTLVPSRLRDTLAPRSGRAALHARFPIPDGRSAYGLVGFHFGPTRKDAVDLSGMDSLVFWARGRGTVRVEFVADTGDGVTSHARTIVLQDTWTRVVLRPSELQPIDSGRRWDIDRRRVRFLQFIGFADLDLHLDDLRYFGSSAP